MSYGPGEPIEDYSTEAAPPPERELARAAKLARGDQSDRGPIEVALDRCDEAATSLAEVAENLHHRLAPILGPARPEPALGEVRPEGDSSPLVDRLDRLAGRIDDARSVLLHTTRRIEL
jgi:hypothetical protein